MEIEFDQAVVRTLTDGLSAAGREALRLRDACVNEFERCLQRYTRLRAELEEHARCAVLDMERAESEAREAADAYQRAMKRLQSATNEAERGRASARMKEARAEMGNAESKQLQAQARLAEAQRRMSALSEAWERDGAAAQAARQQIEESFYACLALSEKGGQALVRYGEILERARRELYGETVPGPAENAGTAESGGKRKGSRQSPSKGQAGMSGRGPASRESSALGTGWCAKNRMSAVYIADGGEKRFSMEIGGRRSSFSCSKSGAAKAYREALRSGDEDLIARTSAIFEIETLREDLELGPGDAEVVQMGGYHGDVRLQDPKGNESHHMPARSVQAVKTDWLPSLSIARSDHKLTASYSGKQQHKYRSFLPDVGLAPTYKEEISQMVASGGAGYVSAIRDELYDLRVSTGHKYDGGVSAFLDAVVDMIASRGIPKCG